MGAIIIFTTLVLMALILSAGFYYSQKLVKQQSEHLLQKIDGSVMNAELNAECNATRVWQKRRDRVMLFTFAGAAFVAVIGGGIYSVWKSYNKLPQFKAGQMQNVPQQAEFAEQSSLTKTQNVILEFSDYKMKLLTEKQAELAILQKQKDAGWAEMQARYGAEFTDKLMKDEYNRKTEVLIAKKSREIKEIEQLTLTDWVNDLSKPTEMAVGLIVLWVASVLIVKRQAQKKAEKLERMLGYSYDRKQQILKKARNTAIIIGAVLLVAYWGCCFIPILPYISWWNLDYMFVFIFSSFMYLIYAAACSDLKI